MSEELQSSPVDFPPDLPHWVSTCGMVFAGCMVGLFARVYGWHAPPGEHWLFLVLGALQGLALAALLAAVLKRVRRRRWEIKRAIEIAENSPCNGGPGAEES